MMFVQTGTDRSTAPAVSVRVTGGAAQNMSIADMMDDQGIWYERNEDAARWQQ